MDGQFQATPPLLLELGGRLSTAVGPNGALASLTKPAAVVRGARRRTAVRRDESGLDRRAARRISDERKFPGHRSPPRDLETLIRRPRLGMGWSGYNPKSGSLSRCI